MRVDIFFTKRSFSVFSFIVNNKMRILGQKFRNGTQMDNESFFFI